MTLIDLGEAPREPSLDEAPPPRRPAVRRLGLVAVLALLLGTIAAAGPAPRPLPSAVVPAPLGAVVVLADDRLFVLDPLTADPAATVPPQVAAYRLPGAVPLARVPLTMRLGGLAQFAGRVGDTLLLNTAGEPLLQRIVAVHALTGAVVWSRDASFEGLTTGGAALLRTGPTDPTGERDLGGVLTAVDVATGETRWSWSYPTGTARSQRYERTGDAVSLLVDRLPTGRLELRDVASGEVTGSIDLPAPAAGAAPADWYPSVVGDLLLIWEGGRTLTAYELGGLVRRWTVGTEESENFWARDCGPVICLDGPRGGTRALDPATGLARWFTDRVIDATPYADRLIGTGGFQATGDSSADVTVLDPGTGKVVAELGRWRVVGPSADGRRLYGVRYGRDGQAWIAELDPAAGSAVVLARLDRVSTECEARRDTLVCRRPDGALGLWDLAG